MQWKGNIQRSSTISRQWNANAHWTTSQHSFGRSNIFIRTMPRKFIKIRRYTSSGEFLQQSTMRNHTKNETHRCRMDDGGKFPCLSPIKWFHQIYSFVFFVEPSILLVYLNRTLCNRFTVLRNSRFISFVIYILFSLRQRLYLYLYVVFFLFPSHFLSFANSIWNVKKRFFVHRSLRSI